MKILFVGIFFNPWSTNIPMALELKKLNHNVICFDYRSKSRPRRNPYYNQLMSIINKKRKWTFFRLLMNFDKFYLNGNWRINRQLYHKVKRNKFDLVFLTKTNTINYKLIPKINQFTKTWYFFMDPLFTALKMEAHKYASSCTWSSSTFSTINRLFKRFGANSFFIIQGLDPRIFTPKKGFNKKNTDVIFVGSKTPKRKHYIDFLKENGINITCYGKRWKNNSIYLKDLVEKYHTSKIILNFTRGKFGFSNRIFQAIGTGSFIISEWCEDLTKFFEKGIHLDWFKTSVELLDLIKYYLKNDQIRENIAQQGYNHICKNFTWHIIMKRICYIIENAENLN